MPSFLLLNNLFPTDEIIDQVIYFKQTNVFPDEIDTQPKRRRFLQKYQLFQVENGNLFYISQLKLDL
jgi:hypothetical protein